ncbi:MAG: hypothetical protein NTX30_20980 [Deltaproteobacteria bacterium]|nr:hypothetical protein [Deltaproteobacteria bacterium]
MSTATLGFLFPGQREVSGPEVMALRAESIGMPISDFELRISDLTVSFSIRIPQSTIRNSGGPPFFLDAGVPFGL